MINIPLTLYVDCEIDNYVSEETYKICFRELDLFEQPDQGSITVDVKIDRNPGICTAKFGYFRGLWKNNNHDDIEGYEGVFGSLRPSSQFLIVMNKGTRSNLSQF